MYYTFFLTVSKDKAPTEKEAWKYIDLNFGYEAKRYGRLAGGTEIDWFNTDRNLSRFSKTTPVESPITTLTDGLYDEFIKVFETDSATAKWTYIDLDNERPCRKFVGEKWFATIDGHACYFFEGHDY